VFDSVRWQQHRSTSRYFRYLDRLLTSRIIRGLFGPMSYVASLCTTVGVYHTLLDWHVLQQLAPDVSQSVGAQLRQQHARGVGLAGLVCSSAPSGCCVAVGDADALQSCAASASPNATKPQQSEWPTLALNSSGIFSISTFALSLLLVFRTNSSYEVGLEGRGWGSHMPSAAAAAVAVLGSTLLLTLLLLLLCRRDARVVIAAAAFACVCSGEWMGAMLNASVQANCTCCLVGQQHNTLPLLHAHTHTHTRSWWEARDCWRMIGARHQHVPLTAIVAASSNAGCHTTACQRAAAAASSD
jgi:hypothetical protein